MISNKYVEKKYTCYKGAKNGGRSKRARDVGERQLADRANTISHKFFYYTRSFRLAKKEGRREDEDDSPTVMQQTMLS